MGAGASAGAAGKETWIGQMNAEKLQALPTLDGKSVLITGVSGIGGAFATMCLHQGAKKVFVVDRLQSALDACMQSTKDAVGDEVAGGLELINADVGTEEGIKKIGSVVGSMPINWMMLGAACPKNVDGMGHNLSTITRDDLDDMINTDVHGKLFLLQALAPNLAGETKARVFNVGVPFSEGPKPDGTYAVVPGWSGLSAAKAAMKWIHEGMKVEMKDLAVFGYGHPFATKTSLTMDMAENYSDKHPLQQMISKRMAAGDMMSPQETAAMWYAMMSKTTDEEFQNTTWTGMKTYMDYGVDLGVKETSDARAGGLIVPAAKKEEEKKE